MAIAKEIHKHFIDIKVNSDIFAYDFDGKSEKPKLVDSDLVIVIGGDGTLLRAGHLCAEKEVPPFGHSSGHTRFFWWKLRIKNGQNKLTA